jgi:esterase/lipase superfamily enzyme
MFFVSSRVNLDNEDRIGSEETYWELTVENQRETRRQKVTLDTLRDFVDGKHILVLVHGYNNEFEDIVRSYDIIQAKVDRHLDDFYDAVIGYTWPGGDSAVDWFGPKRRAGTVAPRLARALMSLNAHAATIDLMSHSLGSRVALRGLEALPNDVVRVNYLMASAIDNESVEAGNKYHDATQRAGESVVFHSRNDNVLRFAYTAAEWDYALGFTGPEDSGAIAAWSPTVTIANCKRVINGHGDYKSEDEVYRFISQWMNGEVDEQFVSI